MSDAIEKKFQINCWQNIVAIPFQLRIIMMTRLSSGIIRLFTSALFILALLSAVGCAGRNRIEGSFTPVPAAAPMEQYMPAPTLAADASTSSPAQLNAALAAIFDDEKFKSAWWGIRVERMDGTVLFERNADKFFMPASAMKLFTTAAALERLGPDFTYETRVEAHGAIDAGGVLRGDLVIVGSGDPSLGAWHPDETQSSQTLLPAWVEAVRAAGIREIAGDIVGDGRIFTPEFHNALWHIEFMPYWFGAGTSGLAMEENCYRIWFRPGDEIGQPAKIEIIPPMDYITIINNTETVAAGGRNTADVVHRSEDNVVRCEGTIAMDREVIKERGAIYDGERYAAYLFKQALEREGIGVNGEPRNIRSEMKTDNHRQMTNDKGQMTHDGNATTLIISHVSPPIREQIKVINKRSHNFFADQHLRTMGARLKEEGSYSAGAAAVKDWLREIGLPEVDGFNQVDGSGLARYNFVSPRQFTHLLRWMHDNSANFGAWLESFPIAGVDGTTSSRMKGTAGEGRVRAKDGYIGRVRASCGYVDTASGETLVFSFLINMHPFPIREADAPVNQACAMMAGMRLGK